jgi:hypothetical protein
MDLQRAWNEGVTQTRRISPTPIHVRISVLSPLRGSERAYINLYLRAFEV